MGRIGWSVFVLGIVAVSVAAALRLPVVQDRLVAQAVRSAMDNREREAELFGGDVLRLLVCGSASPLPARDRARPCLAVIAGGKFWIVDTGPGSWNELALLRIPAERIGGVLYTHFHSDHIGDLGEFNLQTWVAGRTGPLQVYGPPGVERIVAGYTEAFAQDNGYRTAHHGADLLSPEFGTMEARTLPQAADGSSGLAFEDNGLKVSVFPVSHQPVEPAVGYRFDYKGRSIVISGDTRRDENIARVAAGVDVLAHEAQNQEMVGLLHDTAVELGRERYAKVFADIPSYHTSPVDAAMLANSAQAKLLLMYHLTPPPPNRIAEAVFLRGVADIRPEGVELARDGMLLELPVGSDAITVRQLR